MSRSRVLSQVQKSPNLRKKEIQHVSVDKLWERFDRLDSKLEEMESRLTRIETKVGIYVTLIGAAGAGIIALGTVLINHLILSGGPLL